MENLLAFLVFALTALASENAIFSRALGISKPLLFLKTPRMGLLYGALLTWMVTLSSLLTAVVNILLRGMSNTSILLLRAPLYFLCVALIFALTYFGTRRYRPQLHIRIRAALPVSTFNSALFGPLYVSATQNHSVAQTVGYALGAGAGYTLALLVVYYARKRLAISPVPRSFRGLPILLVYIGLLSLAIYGLVGHRLLV